MAIFKHAIKLVLENEGGYVDNSKDLGGTTNFGISLRFLQTIDKNATKDTIKNLTKEDAEYMYFSYFWLPNNYQDFKSQLIANKALDTAVNMGGKIANRFLQQTFNTLIFNGEKLLEDGVLGKKTIDAINMLYEEEVDEAFIKVYSLLQKEHYTKIVISRPQQIEFLKGWFARASK